MDWKRALENVGGDRSLLREVVDTARHEAPDLAGKLKDAMAAQDTRTTQRVACTIKGIANALSAGEMAQVAAGIEESAARNDLNSASRSMSHLRETVDQLIYECEAFLAKQ